MSESSWLTPTFVTSAIAALGALASTAFAWVNWREQRRRPTPDVICTLNPAPVADWWTLSLSISNNTDRNWEIERLVLDKPRSLSGTDSTGTKKVTTAGQVIGKYEYLEDAETAREFRIGNQLYPKSVPSALGGELHTDFFLLNPGDDYQHVTASLYMTTLDANQRRKIVRIRRRFGKRVARQRLRPIEPRTAG